MPQTTLQSALGEPSKSSQPTKPTAGKPFKGVPAQVPGYKPPAQASPTNLASAMFGVAPGSQQAATAAQARPDYSQVEANAEREFMASLANNPQRRAMGNLAAENAAQLDPNRGMPQGVDEGLAGRMAGFGDRRMNRELGRMGVLGNQRGNQFNAGSTAFAGGPLVEAMTGEPRQSSFSAERRDAAIAAIKDGTFRDRAVVDTRPTFRTAEDADRFAAYQDRRSDRRENALAMRQQIGQQREAARQQAMIAQAEAAQNPINSPLFQVLTQRDPRSAAALASSVFGAQSEMQRALMANQQSAAELASRERMGRETLASNETLSKAQIEQRDREIESRAKIASDELAAAERRFQAEQDAGRPSREAQAQLAAAQAKAAEASAAKDQRTAELLLTDDRQRIEQLRQLRSDLEGRTDSESVARIREIDRQLSTLMGVSVPPAETASVGPSTVQDAAITERDKSPLMAALFAVDKPAELSGRDIATDLLDRVGTPRELTDAELIEVQQFVQSRAKLDPDFGYSEGILQSVLGAGPNGEFRSMLFDELMKPEPLTADRLSELRAELEARQKAIDDRYPRRNRGWALPMG